MGLVFSGHVTAANWCFLVSLILMLAALAMGLILCDVQKTIEKGREHPPD
jgi:hypothetical protein